MTLPTTAHSQIRVTAYEWSEPKFFDTFEDALIAVTIEFGRALLRKKNLWTHETNGVVQYGTDADWVTFEIVPKTTGERWRDRVGDIWALGEDGLLHTPETRPFPRAHVEKKWGPLTPVE